jgi:hypothetical protein
MQPMKQTRNLKPFPPPVHRSGELKTRYQEELNPFSNGVGAGDSRLSASSAFSVWSRLWQTTPSGISDQHGLHLCHCRRWPQHHDRIYGAALAGTRGLFRCRRLHGRAPCRQGGFSIFHALPVAGIAAFLVGAVFAIPSLRLKPIYLPMATLAGQFMVEYILRHWVSLTGGSAGLTVPEARSSGAGESFALFYIYRRFSCFWCYG